MIAKALEFYDFKNPNTELIRHNENMIYKITDGNKKYVLRIHKPVEGFDTGNVWLGIEKNDLVAGEIELLTYLKKKGSFVTQKVKFNKYGNAVTMIDDDIPVTVLGWIDGDTLDKIEITEIIAHEMGVLIGKMHNDLAKLTIKNRNSYDETRLIKMTDETVEALKQRYFSKEQANIIIDALSYIRNYFSSAKHKFMLVHTDLSNDNLIYHDGKIIPIDFSAAGFCIPEIDLAMVFGNMNDEVLNKNVLRGYQSVCQMELDYNGIDSCSCLLIFDLSQNAKK